jgi:acyl-CoA reductase-like NAD-dependent aldehyde dehydrogenase
MERHQPLLLTLSGLEKSRQWRFFRIVPALPAGKSVVFRLARSVATRGARVLRTVAGLKPEGIISCLLSRASC